MKFKKKNYKNLFLFFTLLTIITQSNLVYLNIRSSEFEKNNDESLERFNPKIAVSYEWHTLWRINPFDMGYAISIDTNNNVFMVGDGDSKIALVKFDNKGNEIWNRTWGGEDGEVGTGIAVDPNNNVIVTGYGWSFGAGDADIAVVKYNNDGIQLWNQTWGGPNLDSGEGVAIDSNGNIYVTGYTESFDGSDADMVIIKYDVDGNQLWNRTWGGSDDDGAFDIITDSSDDVYITGYTKSYAIKGVRDICVVKYNSSGSQKWNATYGVWDIDQGFGIDIDDSSNVYVAGSITEDGRTYTDSCLIKFNSTGDYQWNKTWGESYNDEAHGIYVDKNYVYMSGFINFQSPNYQDIFVVKCDTSGTEIWNKTWDSGHREYGSDIALDHNGNIYVGGDRDDIGGYNWFLFVKFTLVPGAFSLSSDASDPDPDGLFNLIWSESEDANNYTIYQHDNYITDINGSLTLIAEGIITSPYLMSNLDNSTYYYKIIAFNEFGNSSSNCIKINVSRTIPGNFILSSDADDPDIDGDYELTWTDSELAMNYSLYQHSQYIIEINGSVTMVDEGLTIRNYNFNDVGNGTYFYKVVAFNVNGNRSSNCIRVDIELLSPQLYILSSDAGNPDSDGNFNLIWLESEYAYNYSVYQHDSFITQINGSISLLQEGIFNLYYPISGLDNGTYYFIVLALNDNGNRSSNCIKITVDKIPPGPFTLTSDAEVPDDDGAFILLWNQSLGADNYSLYWSYYPITEFNNSVNLLNEGILSLSYPLSGFPNGDFYFIVVAFNNNGNYTSNYIEVMVRLTPGPFLLTSDAGSPDTDGNFTLSWTISQYADNYSVYYSLSSITVIDETVNLLLNRTMNQSLDISIESDGTYYFMVIAMNKYGTVNSNNLMIVVDIPPEPPGPNGDNMILIIIIISVSVGVIGASILTFTLFRRKRKGTPEIP